MVSLEETISREESSCGLPQGFVCGGQGRMMVLELPLKCPPPAAPQPWQGKEGKNSRLNVGK